MTKKTFVVIGLIAGASILAGCTTWMQPSRVETDFGTSYKLSIFNQTLDPEAEKNLEPVTGFDGQAAMIDLDKYRKSFEKAPEKPAYILGLGTMGQ